jgi:hypothetical protein
VSTYDAALQPVAARDQARVLFGQTIHSVKNVGRGNAAELATYFVEKGKPLVVLAE